MFSVSSFAKIYTLMTDVVVTVRWQNLLKWSGCPNTDKRSEWLTDWGRRRGNASQQTLGGEDWLQHLSSSLQNHVSSLELKQKVDFKMLISLLITFLRYNLMKPVLYLHKTLEYMAEKTWCKTNKMESERVALVWCVLVNIVYKSIKIYVTMKARNHIDLNWLIHVYSQSHYCFILQLLALKI